MATSTAAEVEALRPWGAPAEARSIITVEFEQDEVDGRKIGTLEKTFAGAKGTVRLDYEGQSITDPSMADQVMAELTGDPTEGFFRSIDCEQPSIEHPVDRAGKRNPIPNTVGSHVRNRANMRRLHFRSAAAVDDLEAGHSTCVIVS